MSGDPSIKFRLATREQKEVEGGRLDVGMGENGATIISLFLFFKAQHGVALIYASNIIVAPLSRSISAARLE